MRSRSGGFDHFERRLSERPYSLNQRSQIASECVEHGRNAYGGQYWLVGGSSGSQQEVDKFRSNGCSEVLPS